MDLAGNDALDSKGVRESQSNSGVISMRVGK
jgi:hypothetical protein